MGSELRRFDGRTALVVGAGYGIGRAIARRLAEEGAAVALADIDEAAVRTAAKEIREAASGEPLSAELLPLACDVTDRGSVDVAVAAAAERFGGLDVLVNNVGISTGGDFEEITDADWAPQVDPTLQGTVRCIQAALPHLLESRAPGGAAVVSVTSVNGIAAVGDLVYSTAKAGVENLTRNLAVEYGARNLALAGFEGSSIRFNTVAPGTVRTRVWTERGPERAAYLERFAEMYPLGRVGEPEDIAAAVAFLASADASWITGTTLPVDGGLLAGPLAPLPQATHRGGEAG